MDQKWFKQCLADKKLVDQLKKIKLIISDVDGALTDARVYVAPEGERGRMFSVQDGYIVKYVMQAGIKIALISGKSNQSTVMRGTDLGIPEELCLVGFNSSKLEVINQLQQKLQMSADQTMSWGDDILDANTKLNNIVGLYACPNNAPFYIQPCADIVVPRSGGDSAFRLLMDLLLYVQGKHFAPELISRSL